jgi:secreted trypsin-like serine protease
MNFKGLLVVFVSISVISTSASENTTSKLSSCGLKPPGSGNVYGGNHTKSNSWPWLVALRFKPTNDFFCGGSLIAARIVVSSEIIEMKIATVISF